MMQKVNYFAREASELMPPAIIRTDADGTVWFIPIEPANSDYQAYLRWLENPDAEITYPNF
jgi:hypothetical protein